MRFSILKILVRGYLRLNTKTGVSRHIYTIDWLVFLGMILIIILKDFTCTSKLSFLILGLILTNISESLVCNIHTCISFILTDISKSLVGNIHAWIFMISGSGKYPWNRLLVLNISNFLRIFVRIKIIDTGVMKNQSPIFAFELCSIYSRTICVLISEFAYILADILVLLFFTSEWNFVRLVGVIFILISVHNGYWGVILYGGINGLAILIPWYVRIREYFFTLIR